MTPKAPGKDSWL